MRKLAQSVGIGVALIMTIAASEAFAACGVGSNLWEGNDSTVATISASITNVFTWKLISTTFGLAGCTEEDNWFATNTNAKVHHYASTNFDRLAEAMARGRGEHLDAFAHLLQVSDEDQPHFRALVQGNFEVLFPHDRVTVREMLDVLGHLMAADETLSLYRRS